jgi:hypothetical protein
MAHKSISEQAVADLKTAGAVLVEGLAWPTSEGL